MFLSFKLSSFLTPVQLGWFSKVVVLILKTFEFQ